MSALPLLHRLQRPLVIGRSILLIAAWLVAVPAAMAQERSNGIGVYLDSAGSVCNGEFALGQSFDAYVIASNLSDDLTSIEFRFSHSPQLRVLSRELNLTHFAAVDPLILESAEEWGLEASGCVQRRSLVLVRYRMEQRLPAQNLTICAEPTTIDPSPPTYVSCALVTHPMQPAYAGASVQEGCAVINSSSAEGSVGPLALCDGAVTGASVSWSTIKARFH